ncbi:MAG: hypothetical protein WBE65_16150, partial [Steroidobacteraceae bacterium]
SFGEGARSFTDVSELLGALSAALAAPADDVRLLIKGSRVNRLERVVVALAPEAASAGGAH